MKHIATTLKKLGLGLFLVLLTLTAILYTRVGGDARVYAATSSNLNFQARLLNASGGLVPDGTYNIEFKLYDTLAAGASAQGVCVGGATDDCLWVETRTGANKVTIKNGYLSVNLASVTAFPAINWDQDLWLTMNIGGTGAPGWDGEMSPRVKLTAVPYAFDSGQLDGIDSTGFAQLAPSSVQVINAALAALRLNQTGAGLLAQWQGDGADVFTVSKTGAVTAGTYNTNTFTGTALTFGGAGATTIQAATNQGLTVQSQGTGGLTLTSGSGTVVLGSNTLQNVSSAMTLDVNNAGLSTFNIVNNNGTNLANLDVEGGLFAGNANSFSVNSDGDITAVFTTLNGSSTTNGAAIVASTSMTLADASNFDVGNYIKLDNNGAGCSGSVTICYVKVTAKATNTLTITPALTWSTGRTVTEVHIPEIGGLDTSQTLENRYGRGYFIAGVVTGNGTTYYNEDGINSSLANFDLLNTGVATLNIGGAATTINLGTAGTTLVLPGTFDIQGASLNIGTATQQGSLILQNGDSKTGTIQVGTLSANRTYILPDVSGTICLTTTCTGGGGGPVDAFTQDGNAFGVNATLGTNDNYGLIFETNSTQRMSIDTNGNIGIGTSGSPSQLLSIGGTTGNFTVNSSGAVVAVGLTSSAGLTVSAGGASVTGGLNNNSGGITNAGSITGVGSDITATSGLTIASGGSGDLALTSASGLITLGASTVQTADSLLFNLANAIDTTLSLQNGGAGITNLNLVDGGLLTGGTIRLTNGGALQNITGLTVSSGNANFNGNVTIGDTTADRLTITSQILGASALIFQGATDDSFTTALGLTDPTANNTILLPNASGTLVLDSRNITTATGSGLTGGGNLSADLSLSLDINGLTSKTNVNPTDYIAVHDATTSSIRKISRNDFLQGLIGALIYRGTWDASTNTPTLADNTGTQGDMYVVSVAGTQNFGQGPGITFGVGDFVIHNGTDWERAPSSADVSSVFGRTGAITAQNGDYTGLQITNTPSGSIAAVTVQAAINELAAEKIGSLNGLTTISQTFANDTNVTITSSGSTHTLGWAGLLAVGRGGTGANTFTSNGVVFGNGTGALQVTAAGTGGQVLLANATGVPTFTSLSGDITVSSTGVTSIGANTINLTTDTVGNYVANLGTLTGLSATGNTGEGSTPALSILYGSIANTAVQGNTTITVTAGTNLGGGGTITLGTGGTVTLNTIASPTFTTVTASTFTSTAGLTVSSGGAGDLTLDSASNKVIIAGTDTTLERTGAGSYTVDLKDNAATSLVLSNSSAGGSSVANLNLLDGALQIAGVTVIDSDRSLNVAGLTNVGAFTTSGGIASINAASNFATNINTGSSTGTITLGGGTAPLVINSTAFDVTSAGALSGITTIVTSGNITSGGSFIGNGQSGDTLAACTTSQYIGNGVKLDDGLITAGTCRDDATGISDMRVKKNITSVGSVLDRMKDLNIVSFDFRRDELPELNLDRGLQYGVIAQELEKIFPELVKDREDGYKEVNFQGLNFYNLKAVTELAKRVGNIDNTQMAAPNEVITNGQVRLTSEGELQNINGLRMVSGGASVIGGIDNNGGGITEAGSIKDATTIDAQSLHLTAATEGDLLILTKDGQGVFTVFNNGALQLKLDATNAFSVKKAAGDDIFSINSEGGLVRIGSSGSDSTAVLLVLDNVEMDGDPTGVNGAQYYNTKSDKFRCYQNDRWQNCLSAGSAEYVITSQPFSWNQPLNDEEIPGKPRIWTDLSNATSFRMTMQVNIPGAEKAQCQIQFATAEAGPWFSLDYKDTFIGINQTGTLKSEWVDIKPHAYQEIILRVMCRGGDYPATLPGQIAKKPEISNIRLQVR